MESSLEFSSSIGSISSLASSPCRVFKIIVIGDSGVGKTCLTYRFCNGQFPDKTEATIGVDFRERLIDMDGDKVKLQLWDTAGQERFRKSMVQHYYRNVQAVVFVYDVTSPASFRALPVWLEECRQNGLGNDVPRFLVGNKSDLQTDRQVPRDQAGKFAEVNGMTLFLTSAKSPPNRPGRGSAGTGSGSPQHHHNQQQDDAEAIFVALASRLGRQKRPVTVNSVSGYSSSFKIQAKKKAPKWNCTC